MATTPPPRRQGAVMKADFLESLNVFGSSPVLEACTYLLKHSMMFLDPLGLTSFLSSHKG